MFQLYSCILTVCVCVLFVYNNQCVDKVYLTTPMDLSGIPWLFIYLLLLRGVLEILHNTSTFFVVAFATYQGQW